MGLLIQEPPLQVLPSLAKAIGLNEAIVLQQIHYWLQKSSNIEVGHKWIYNTYNAWQKQFPFWSIPTIRRTITSLEKQGVIVTGNFNKAGFDNTKWYRIDYQKLESMSRRCDQNDQTMRSIWTDGADQNDQTNTNRLPETTTNISSGKPNDHLSESFESIWKEYPNKAGKKDAFRHYKKWRKESKEHTDEYLMEKLKAYKKDLAENPWKKPMNGSTWFNGRFDDEYATSIMDQQPNRAKGYQF
ncbi:hypothetical protein HCY76_09955 [Limosilactobacillus fermentum]